MVTIAITEEDNTISDLLKTALALKGQRVSRSTNDTDAEYLLLPPDTCRKSDVLLLHEPSSSQKAQAEYITILNADKNTAFSLGEKSLVITYGLNPLATITASSLSPGPEQTNFLCCLQRSIVTLKGKVIEPQEFPVILPKAITDMTAAMGFVSLGLTLSFEPEEFCSCFLPYKP